jgi:hypothetical protein
MLSFCSFIIKVVITVWCCCSWQPPCLFTAHMGSGSYILSCGVFLPLPLSQAFPLLVAGHVPPLLLEPLLPARLVYLQFREGFPSPNPQRSVCPTLFPLCLYCSYCLLLSFSFFPGWRLVCPGGYASLAQGCLWEYRGTAKLTVCIFPSHLVTGIWQPTGPPGFSVNVKWRCSALAGGVDGSKNCVFSVVLPAKCVCSISPRFHYRMLTFCFLPLAAILESSSAFLFRSLES